MCGITGIVKRDNSKVNVSELKKMNQLISHRGPDDEGFLFESYFAFGHRRLSILDLSADGHQPMVYLNKYTITYNGEIYNYLELKKELLDEGYTFSSDTDTEVILASYDKWGENCVSKFNGMWAFSLYDKEKNILFCSRDRFGIKPFYYTEVENNFVFGSEIKQLLLFYPKRYVNKSILMDYLVIGFEEHSNETFFENIFKLPPSHNLIYDLSTHIYQTKKYYDIEIKPKDKDKKESAWIQEYKEKLEASIALRLRSDVKVGACLSGGLDSSSIASIASILYHKESHENFMAIHAKSTEKSNDESVFAKEVAKHCKLDLKIIEPLAEDFINNIDEVVYTQEEPFGSASIFMQYFVMQKAKQEKCTVMLDGQGGDETLLGYERYYPAYLKSLSFIPMWKAFFLSTQNSKLSKKQLLAYMLYFTQAKIRISRLKKRNNFIKKRYLDLINSRYIEESSANYLDIQKLQYQEIYQTQMPHLLRYEDKNSMRHSIETRLPFIDYHVLETALSMPHSLKINQGWSKYILRKIVNSILPHSIVWRKNKLGFEAPSKTWLSSIQSQMQESITHSKILSELIEKKLDFQTLNEGQKWKLYNIAKWEEVYKIEIN